MKKIIIFGITFVSVLAAVQYVAMLMGEVALFERYPEYDQDVIIKAHRMMVRRAFTGHYSDIKLDDETADRIFRSIVTEISE